MSSCRECKFQTYKSWEGAVKQVVRQAGGWLACSMLALSQGDESAEVFVQVQA